MLPIHVVYGNDEITGPTCTIVSDCGRSGPMVSLHVHRHTDASW